MGGADPGRGAQNAELGYHTSTARIIDAIDTVHVCAVCGSRREEPGAPVTAGEVLEVDASTGKRIFHTVCETCQAAGRKATAPPLTWRRVVALVEAKLAEAGLEDIEIAWVDFGGGWDGTEEPSVFIEDGRLAISG